MILERAQESDLPAIVTLMNAAFRGTGANPGWSTEAAYITGPRTTEPLLREEIAAGAHFLVARQEDALSGCVSLRQLTPDRWYLGSLTVPPAAQNGGSGRRLLQAAENYAAAHGARSIEMTVIQIRNTLIAWYHRRGYVLTGQTRPFPYGDHRFGTPTRDDLCFVVLEKHLPASSASPQR